jgi:hypothetical protein
LQKVFEMQNQERKKVFATANRVCKIFDRKADKPENLKIKRFCKSKLQTGKKVFAKWENSFDKHKNSNLISHLKLKRQTSNHQT